MSIHGLFARSLLGVGIVAVAVVAVIGGVVLGGSGIAAVSLAGVLAACLGAVVVRETPVGRSAGAASEAACRTAAWTVGVLLVLAGTAALAGGVAAAALAGAGVCACFGWLIRVSETSRGRSVGASPGTQQPRPPTPQLPPTQQQQQPTTTQPSPPTTPQPSDTLRAVDALPSVAAMPTEALGREWLLTTDALAGGLTASARGLGAVAAGGSRRTGAA